MGHMGNRNKFIPFNENTAKPENKISEAEQRRQDIIRAATLISIEGSSLFSEALNKEKANLLKLEEMANNLNEKIQEVLKLISESKPKPAFIIPQPAPKKTFTGATDFNQIVYNFPIHKMFDVPSEEEQDKDRSLPNGGMAPPKFWEVNLQEPLKESLIEEMRRLRDSGQVINKSNYHHKPSLSVEEFTEPFKYIENMHDYNGSFLVSLLKSEIEINNQAAVYQTDLSADKQGCINEERLILSIYDISGSPSKNEEKKFLIVLLFDKFQGTIKYDHTIFMGGEKLSFSHRQQIELEKFCKSKKIIL